MDSFQVLQHHGYRLVTISESWQALIGFYDRKLALLSFSPDLKHEMHVEYSTVWGLRGHFRYQKKFFGTFFQTTQKKDFSKESQRTS